MQRPGKVYLGDSVYVEVERGMFKLTTENGLPDDPGNTIYLENTVLAGLIQYAHVVKEYYTRASEERTGED